MYGIQVPIFILPSEITSTCPACCAEKGIHIYGWYLKFSTVHSISIVEYGELSRNRTRSATLQHAQNQGQIQTCIERASLFSLHIIQMYLCTPKVRRHWYFVQQTQWAFRRFNKARASLTAVKREKKYFFTCRRPTQKGTIIYQSRHSMAMSRCDHPRQLESMSNRRSTICRSRGVRRWQAYTTTRIRLSCGMYRRATNGG